MNTMAPAVAMPARAPNGSQDVPPADSALSGHSAMPPTSPFGGVTQLGPALKLAICPRQLPGWPPATVAFEE